MEPGRPEARLLLACARSVLDAGETERIRAAIAEGVDWDVVMRAAQRNYIVPLLCTNLLAACPELLPPDLRALFRSSMVAHAARNLLATRELGRLLDTLERGGVAAIAFKGPTLAVRAYGSVSLRQFGDLDVLVRERDALRAVRLLEASGYTLDSPIDAVSDPHQKDVALTSACGRTRIELHWRLSRAYFSFSLDTRRNARRLWESTETVEVGGRATRSLPVVDLLLYLCSHGAKHRWERLEWICDVAELIRSTPDLDWAEVERRATVLGCDRVLALGLLLASELLGAPIPERVRRRVSLDTHVRPAFELTRSLLFEERRSFAHTLEKHQYRHVLKERFADRLRLGVTYSGVYLRVLFRPSARDRELVPVPEWLSFVHYATRPARLGVSYFGKAIKAAFARK